MLSSILFQTRARFCGWVTAWSARGNDLGCGHGLQAEPAATPAGLEEASARDTMGGFTRIAVMGAGGVGGYFGARLAQTGHEVAFVARGRHLEALRDHGLRVESPLGDS